jgi:hypothetical protein
MLCRRPSDKPWAAQGYTFREAEDLAEEIAGISFLISKLILEYI